MCLEGFLRYFCNHSEVWFRFLRAFPESLVLNLSQTLYPFSISVILSILYHPIADVRDYKNVSVQYNAFITEHCAGKKTFKLMGPVPGWGPCVFTSYFFLGLSLRDDDLTMIITYLLFTSYFSLLTLVYFISFSTSPSITSFPHLATSSFNFSHSLSPSNCSQQRFL